MGILFYILLIFLIGFACFHIFLALAGGVVFALAGTAWAVLVASICLVSIAILAVFLFAGFWIFILGGIIGLWILISLILFPIFLPILLPLLLVFLVVFLLRKKEQKVRQLP